MGNLNKVFLIGRLGQEPEKKVTNTGTAVVNISLATNDFFTDRSGNKQERTEWHRLVLWGRLADLISQYTRKGSQIYVEGSLRTREWQDKDNNKRYTTEVVAQNIQLLDPAGQSQNNPQSGGYSQDAGRGYGNPYGGQPQYGNPPPQGNYGSQPAHAPSPPPMEEGGGFIEDDVPF